MKKVASLLTAMTVSLTGATTVMAEWHGSITQNGGVQIPSGSNFTTSEGNTLDPNLITVLPVAEADSNTQSIAEVLKSTDVNNVTEFIEKFDNAEATISALSSKIGDVNSLTPVNLFEIKVNYDLAKGETVDVPVKVDGVKAGDEVVALYFAGDATAAVPTSGFSARNAVSPVSARALTAKEVSTAAATQSVSVGTSKLDANGNVVLTVSGTTPVMILKKNTTGTQGQTKPETNVETNKTPGTGDNSNVAIWVGVLVVAVVAVGAVVYYRKKSSK